MISVNVFSEEKAWSRRLKNKNIKFFFPSSIAVYNVNDTHTICSEDDCLNPSTVYGCNKLYIEKLGSYYSHTYNQLNKNDYLMVKGSNATGLNKLSKQIIAGKKYAL